MTPARLAQRGAMSVRGAVPALVLLLAAGASATTCPNLAALYQSVDQLACTTTTTTVTVVTSTVTTQTTATATATTATTTATTQTTVTTTVTTQTTVTVTATTVTTTVTTQTTVTVTATTATTTTTTSFRACHLCDELPITDSQTTLNANAELDATAQASSCLEVVSTAALKLTCPATNLVTGGPVTVTTGAYPTVKCMVCGISVGADSDLSSGSYSGRVSWGQNVKAGALDEGDIKEYKLYLVSLGAGTAMTKIGGALGTVTKTSDAVSGTTCCTVDKYHVDVSGLALAAGGGTYVFMVAPVDTNNVELKIGRVSAAITDDATGNANTGQASGARRGAGLALGGAVLAGALALSALSALA